MKIFRGHALQTLGKRGKRPFYFNLDHQAHHLIFIPSNGNFVQNLTGHQFGKQETIKNAYHKHQFGNVYRGNKLHSHINENLA